MAKDWNAINASRLESFDVASMGTEFTEAAAALREMGQMVGRITERRIALLEAAAQEIGVKILQEYTPKRTGALAASTEAFLYRADAQWVVAFEQPATNRQGTEYAPFVILGHRTRNPEVSVPPNPYNREALAAMEEPMNAMIAETGRQIGSDLLEVMHEREAK